MHLAQHYTDPGGECFKWCLPDEIMVRVVGKKYRECAKPAQLPQAVTSQARYNSAIKMLAKDSTF